MPRIEPTLPKPKQATATAAHDAATPEKRTLTPAAKRYESVMRDFMSYIGETTEFYPEGHTFTDTELSEVTPDNIVRYFTFKLYGDGDVNPSESKLFYSHLCCFLLLTLDFSVFTSYLLSTSASVFSFNYHCVV